MNEPSEMYLRALKQAEQHHLTTKTYSGKFLRPHAPIIRALLEQVPNRAVLDYGCGKGEQYSWVSHGDDASIPGGMTIQQFWGDPPLCLFDPAYPPLALEQPEEFAARVLRGGKFGATIVTHVLGSIPIGDLVGWVLPRLAALTDGAIYIAEKIGPVGKQVFGEEEAPALPRFSRAYWCGFIWGASVAFPDQRWILATNERTPEGKIASIREFRNGERIPVDWLPEAGATWRTDL